MMTTEMASTGARQGLGAHGSAAGGVRDERGPLRGVTEHAPRHASGARASAPSRAAAMTVPAHRAATGTTSSAPAGATAAEPVLEVRHVEKVYGGRMAVTRALADVSFTVEAGEFVAIMGASGSGKSTLLNCISTIDRVTSGTVLINGADVTQMKPKELARFRREQLGFIFQDSNLLDTLTARENIALPLTIARVPAREVLARVEETAGRLGIGMVLDNYPYQMSGGQQQRVAAARALVTNPALIMADEPTGALDSKNARLMLESFETMNATLAATVLMVTHDSFAASYTHRVLFIRDGRIFTELRRGDASRQAFFQRIMEVVAMMGGEAADAL